MQLLIMKMRGAWVATFQVVREVTAVKTSKGFVFQLLCLMVAGVGLFCVAQPDAMGESSGILFAWGDQVLPNVRPGTRFSSISAGAFCSFALREDGTVVAWGNNGNGECRVSRNLNGVTAIAPGMALKRDGTVVSLVGDSFPLSNIVAIANGVALRSNGTVAVWGGNSYGQTNVPPKLTNVVAIGSGRFHRLALRANGTVVAWGGNVAFCNGLQLCFTGQATVPPGLSNVVAIAAGGFHSLALKSDGTVVAWGAGGIGQSGQSHHGQSIVPSGLENVVAIAAGGYHSLALKGDGSVVAWGENSEGESTVLPGLSNVVAIAAGGTHSLALRSDGSLVAWGSNRAGEGMIPWEYKVKAIASGMVDLAIRDDGSVISWGEPAYLPPSPLIDPCIIQ